MKRRICENHKLHPTIEKFTIKFVTKNLENQDIIKKYYKDANLNNRRGMKRASLVVIRVIDSYHLLSYNRAAVRRGGLGTFLTGFTSASHCGRVAVCIGNCTEAAFPFPPNCCQYMFINIIRPKFMISTTKGNLFLFV